MTRRIVIFSLLSAGAMCCQNAPQMAVSAPYAQKLALQMMEEHHELHKIGIHATPPNSSDNVIIAASIPSKIGKKSSAKDMQLLATGTPQAAKVDKDSIYDLLIPLSDKNGGVIGFVVMEIPFTQARNKEDALQKGVAIRDDMQKQISSKEQLFQ